MKTHVLHVCVSEIHIILRSTCHKMYPTILTGELSHFCCYCRCSQLLIWLAIAHFAAPERARYYFTWEWTLRAHCYVPWRRPEGPDFISHRDIIFHRVGPMLYPMQSPEGPILMARYYFFYMLTWRHRYCFPFGDPKGPDVMPSGGGGKGLILQPRPPLDLENQDWKGPKGLPTSSCW